VCAERICHIKLPNSVLQCVELCCNCVVQPGSVWLLRVESPLNSDLCVLQCARVCYSVLECVAA